MPSLLLNTSKIGCLSGEMACCLGMYIVMWKDHITAGNGVANRKRKNEEPSHPTPSNLIAVLKNYY